MPTKILRQLVSAMFKVFIFSAGFWVLSAVSADAAHPGKIPVPERSPNSHHHAERAPRRRAVAHAAYEPTLTPEKKRRFRDRSWSFVTGNMSRSCWTTLALNTFRYVQLRAVAPRTPEIEAEIKDVKEDLSDMGVGLGIGEIAKSFDLNARRLNEVFLNVVTHIDVYGEPQSEKERAIMDDFNDAERREQASTRSRRAAAKFFAFNDHMLDADHNWNYRDAPERGGDFDERDTNWLNGGLPRIEISAAELERMDASPIEWWEDRGETEAEMRERENREAAADSHERGEPRDHHPQREHTAERGHHR